MNFSSPAVIGPGTGWFDPAYKRRQGASGPQMGTVSKGEKNKGGKRKREAAGDAEKKVGPEQGPMNPNKQARREKREKTAKEAAESAYQRVQELERQTAETDKLGAELDELLVSGQNPERLTQLMGLIRQSRAARETAKKQEQDKQVKEHEDAVERVKRAEEQLQQAHDHLRTVRARMDPALVSTLRAVNMPIRTAEPSSQDRELAAATAKTALEQPDEKMEENV
ncbi:MAG: hypothetical protein OHK93_002039 [Ramalina farinacea]|uniref:Uncharacterized protein n=1 Tax=Ramalina farinacea TaxID=258253 RepID=A0AA43QSM9_9LECA|nr:hypothetical protein [Ramalina farinacea]